MSVVFDSITNRGEYLAAHYFAEELPDALKKRPLAEWTLIEKDPHDERTTPRQRVRALRGGYFTSEAREFFADATDLDAAAPKPDRELAERLTAWHRKVLVALGFSDEPGELTVHRSGRDHKIPVAWHGAGIVALDCGWTKTVDDAVADTGAGLLLCPVALSASERYESGQRLAAWLFGCDLGEQGGPRPRFVLLLCGGVIVLADRKTWSEGRFLAANLDLALERNDTRQGGELATIAALFSHGMLTSAGDGTEIGLDELLGASTNNSVGVNRDLRAGLQRSVEILANEVLDRLRAAGVTPAEIEGKVPFARQLTRETLRYLYRVLFLLYAESRPELRILPADDGSYEAGYSMARLRELVARDEVLVEEEAKHGYHLYASLDLLFTKVNSGHRPYGSEPDDVLPGDDAATVQAKDNRRSEDRGLRFEPLRSELFDRDAITLIGMHAHHGRELDVRPRNTALHEVLRLLTMKRADRRGGRGGFISYRNLGINQLGAVYEGLMSYTGVIAAEELCEVAKKGKPEAGSWLIPAHRQSDYPAETLVHYDEHDEARGRRGVKRYSPGTFVYRLAGRERETTASYYTPESLTKVTVELALRHLMDEDTPAARLLSLKICEPALGSGAFLNEAINQVAEEYLRRRQEELGVSVPTERALAEKQKVKAYIALHNAYGVDLNATGVELAEVSLWLNTMHPGMRAPWFGLHLRRGNSLIGARRAVYSGDDVQAGEWARDKDSLGPDPLPFLDGGSRPSLPDDAVHQFLLPSPGWGAATGSDEAKKLAGEDVKRLRAWRRAVVRAPKKSRAKRTQFTRLRDAARRVEFLWALVEKRMELSEEAIARRIDVWGADPSDPAFAFLRRPADPTPKEKVLADLFDAADTPYWRLRTVLDAWCALWFWPVDGAALLDGTDPAYAEPEPEPDLADLLGTVDPGPRIIRQGELFPTVGQQDMVDDEFGSVHTIEVKPARKPEQAKQVRRHVPLANLDDWLDFLEAMLGTQDVPDGSLFREIPDLEQLKNYEDSLPGQMGMYRGDPEARFPWLHTVRDLAGEHGFLHWELEFALVFATGGGFDLQVGNPPWVRPRWNEAAVLAEYDPWWELTEKPSTADKNTNRTKLLEDPAARDYVLRESVAVTAQVALFGSPQVYPLLTGTQPDLYRAFMAQIWAHAAATGTAGMIHPDTHFVGEKEGRLRAAAYHRLRVHGDFVNVNHRFFPKPVGESSHFGVHIYGPARDIAFDHLSWLVSTDALRHSREADDAKELPEYRTAAGKLDERPHPARVIEIEPELLATWRHLLGGEDQPLDETRLLFPVSTAELPAIEALANYPYRLGMQSPRISSGYHESGSKKDGLIEYNRVDSTTGSEYQPESWRRVVLKGIQLGVATPAFKRHDANSNDPHGADLARLPDDFVPDTEYVRVPGRTPQYLAAQDRWLDHQALADLRGSDRALVRARIEVARALGIAEDEVTPSAVDAVLTRRAQRRYTTFSRLAWRRQIAPDTERVLFGALIPPGAAHVDNVHTLALAEKIQTCLVAGFFAAIPLEYFIRITNLSDLRPGSAKALLAPQAGHPLASALLLRTLRLNCLTTEYRRLWREGYDPAWRDDGWAVRWPGLTPLQDVSPKWIYNTPLRTEQARRSALVEIDALVAVWLGMDVDTLIAAYRGRFPVLRKFEAATYFDAAGSKLAGNARTHGQRQGKESWKQLQEHLADPERVPPPERYVAPMHKVDREAELRAAHAAFQERLAEEQEVSGA
ncbi:class I SAM-dependent DNA methyltransferase [Amycolatopsis sp. PS_44_ISF1]|uniref:class I SAM-dependent DNA methyltransferase n=1 Tax=Amycolatopsis sp. PS_44_ISF1 TaxID=2974917 RepID=UPI0028DEE8A8|nr:class I SAM-dependent DNA methyltransferase [Amycolatopsis sp. PS_44_ISF1]MDT8910050.1 class I SAM-dependent DNA methyltransferase [Amycolatopsis sp. PS_44_ISF1]